MLGQTVKLVGYGPQLLGDSLGWLDHESDCWLCSHCWLGPAQDGIMGGTTPDTHGRLHGLRPQGWSSPQDEALWSTTLLGVPRKTPGRYPEDTTRSVC